MIVGIAVIALGAALAIWVNDHTKFGQSDADIFEEVSSG